MHLNRQEFHVILALFAIYLPRHGSCEEISETSKEKIVKRREKDSSSKSGGIKTCQGEKCLGYWMAIMGSMHPDLMNVQAIIVKEENEPESCDKADRKSQQRYLMCAGSILNRNLVLTSASCLHTATHIRHNIRGTLSVAIAPLKPGMQIIRIQEYKINPSHVTNPYSSDYLKHNIAILRLACRIEMGNLHKVELPQGPFVQTCEEDNCIVAVYRKIGRTRWVMFQKLAPHVPFSSRRKKETMTKDVESRKSMENDKNETTNYGNKRTKRKLAEPPKFDSRPGSGKVNDGSENVRTNSETISTKLSLEDEEYENWSRPVTNGTNRRFVVRSSDGHRGCAQTGAAVMYNRTQVAIAAVTCDDRQSSTKWGYTDLYENIDWIRETLQSWNTNPSVSVPTVGGGSIFGTTAPEISPRPGNHSSRGTCIYNFFIDLGCKDKNGCGNKSTHLSLDKLPTSHESGAPLELDDAINCPNSNGMDVEIAVGRGCRRKDRKLEQTPDNHGNWAESLNDNTDSDGLKNSRSIAKDKISKPEQPVTVGSSRASVIKDQPSDKEKYMRKDLSRVLEIPQIIPEHAAFLSRMYRIPKNDDKKHEKASNEIGPGNIEGNSNNWLAEVERKFHVTSGFKRDMIEPQHSSRRFAF